VIDTLVRNFICSPPKPITPKDGDGGVKTNGKTRTKVVVNLGCGSDVLPWQCLTRYREHCGDVKFVDVDFPDLIERKRRTVFENPELIGMFTGVKERRADVVIPQAAAPTAATPTATTASSDATTTTTTTPKEDSKDKKPTPAPSPTTRPHPIVFESNEYFQVGCDLRDLKTLEASLADILGPDFHHECTFIFVAEVSITYMETEGADAVIQWASTLSDHSEFVLLEQILPAGAAHPFASTMLTHFDKLNTQIKSVDKYPTVESQHARFVAKGWNSSASRVWTLWEAWADEKDAFLTAGERRKLDEVEPFDEWEEFALFASHYCVVHAKTPAGGKDDGEGVEGKGVVDVPTEEVNLKYDVSQGQRGQRRFGAAMRLSSSPSSSPSEALVNVMGLGNKGRLQSCDVFTRQQQDTTTASSPNDMIVTPSGFTLTEGGPTSRMCHSVTTLAPTMHILAGGRASPSMPLKDCWLFDATEKGWKRAHDLPTPLYRHAITELSGAGELALLVGGKTGAGAKDIFNGALVYAGPEKGWVSCEIVGDFKPIPVYGAVLACNKSNTNIADKTFTGVYAGGLRDDGVVAQQVLSWELDISDLEKPTIRFTPLKVAAKHLLSRFGATCVALPTSNEFLLLGGVIADHLLQPEDNFLVFSVDDASKTCVITKRLVDSKMITSTASPKQDKAAAAVPQPLLVGTSVITIPDQNEVVILGGGATCFSMGTFWNKGVYTLQLPTTTTSSSHSSQGWIHEKTIEIIPGDPPKKPTTTLPIHPNPSGTTAKNSHDGPHHHRHNITPIPRVTLSSPSDFSNLLRQGKPAIITGLNLGPCVGKWDDLQGYVTDKVGSGRKIVVHELPSSHHQQQQQPSKSTSTSTTTTPASMDFTAKNFRYVTTTFGEFASRVVRGDRLYLRALSTDKPSEKPAVLADDFPELSRDFVLPAELETVEENLFSSVLRVSGPVNMWLHYDVSFFLVSFFIFTHPPLMVPSLIITNAA